MKKSYICGCIFTIIIGAILHFTFAWSNENFFVALFSPVNESVWEHLKLLFFPYILYMIIEFFINEKEVSYYLTAKTIGLFSGMLFLPILFYTYTYLLGDNYLILDIITFMLSVIISYVISYYIHKNQVCNLTIISLLSFIFLFFLIDYYTFHPPSLKIFLFPISHTFVF